MEDVLRLEHGLNGGFTFAAVLDGHGGALSAQWLYDELFEAVASKANASLLDDAQQPPEQQRQSSGKNGNGKARCASGVELLPDIRWPAKAGAVLSKVFHETDEKLINFLRTEFGIEQTGVSGSTALVALIHPTRAIFACLGDCMAVVCRNGAPALATPRHRVYGSGPDVLEEVERVEATGAWVIDGRVCNVLAVSRAFGDPEFKGAGLRTLLQEGARKGLWSQEFASTHQFKGDPVIVEPDVTEVRFTPGDEFILMATDGLWDYMGPSDAVQYARKQFLKGKTAQEVAEAVTAVALKRYTGDNVGCVVVDLRRGAAAGGGGGGGTRSGGGGTRSGGGTASGKQTERGGWLGGLFGSR